MTGSTIGLAALGLAGLVGLGGLVTVAALVLRRGERARGHPTGATDGRGVLPPDLSPPAGTLLLLQLSSQFCPSCRDTRALLADVSGGSPRLAHRDVDVAARPELMRLLSIRRTPTTLAVGSDGTEVLRVVGVPRRAELLSALAPHLSR